MTLKKKITPIALYLTQNQNNVICCQFSIIFKEPITEIKDKHIWHQQLGAQGHSTAINVFRAINTTSSLSMIYLIIIFDSGQSLYLIINRPFKQISVYLSKATFLKNVSSSSFLYLFNICVCCNFLTMLTILMNN